ncbi:MAG: hypothetical protein HY903_21685 [Deltaproteobacteria bacterium]|nr:hypothetical protein [Deltaproteobacteria bacterium]
MSSFRSLGLASSVAVLFAACGDGSVDTGDLIPDLDAELAPALDDGASDDEVGLELDAGDPGVGAATLPSLPVSPASATPPPFDESTTFQVECRIRAIEFNSEKCVLTIGTTKRSCIVTSKDDAGIGHCYMAVPRSLLAPFANVTNALSVFSDANESVKQVYFTYVPSASRKVAAFYHTPGRDLFDTDGANPKLGGMLLTTLSATWLRKDLCKLDPAAGAERLFDYRVKIPHGHVPSVVRSPLPSHMRCGASPRAKVACVDGFADVDGVFENGCEVDLSTVLLSCADTDDGGLGQHIARDEEANVGFDIGDSLYGLNIYELGTVTLKSGAVTVGLSADYCVDASTLRESFCGHRITDTAILVTGIKHRDLRCDWGCVDGACVPKGKTSFTGQYVGIATPESPSPFTCDSYEDATAVPATGAGGGVLDSADPNKFGWFFNRWVAALEADNKGFADATGEDGDYTKIWEYTCATQHRVVWDYHCNCTLNDFVKQEFTCASGEVECIYMVWSPEDNEAMPLPGFMASSSAGRTCRCK